MNIFGGILSGMKSWKTALFGLVSGLIIVLSQIQFAIDADPSTKFVWETFSAGLGLMGIGIFARDNDKSSENVGAGKK